MAIDRQDARRRVRRLSPSCTTANCSALESNSSTNYYVHKKLTLVGPGYIGKTSLLLAALQGHYPPTEQPFETCPGVYECTVRNAAGKDIEVQLKLWDSAGSFEYDRLRPLLYPGASVVVIAFAIDRPDYFELIEEMITDRQQTLPEVDCGAPGVPIILVGLRKDARDNSGRDNTREAEFTSREMGEQVARRIGALAFVECSSFTGEGVEEVFEAAARAALFGPPRRVKKGKKRIGIRRRTTNCVVF